MIKQIFIRKPKISVKEIAATIYAKFFKDELKRTYRKLSQDMTHQARNAEKEKFILAIVSLFVFIVEYSTYSVFGETKTKNKILSSFYSIIMQDYKEHFRIIIDQAQRYALMNIKKPDDPLFGLGMSFAKSIHNERNVLTAMTGCSESVKKSRIIMKYYHQVNQEFRIH